WTIGHSTRRIDIFLSLLEENGIKLVADVRIFPGSKRYPQFGRGALAESLGEHGIRYEHFPELGGRRKAKPDSTNTAWRDEMVRAAGVDTTSNRARAQCTQAPEAQWTHAPSFVRRATETTPTMCRAGAAAGYQWYKAAIFSTKSGLVR